MKKYLISPATIMSAVALFFSLGVGGAVAAQHYLITSRHQIKPSVLRHLTTPQLTHTVFGPYAQVDQASGPIIVAAYCPTGTRVTGGGLDRSSPYLISGENTAILSSEPTGAGAWGVEVTNTGAASVEVRAVAVCLGSA